MKCWNTKKIQWKYIKHPLTTEILQGLTFCSICFISSPIYWSNGRIFKICVDCVFITFYHEIISNLQKCWKNSIKKLANSLKKYYVIKKKKNPPNRKLTCNIVLLTKIQILFKFYKILCQCPLFVFMIPYSWFHIVFGCIEQLQLHTTNSDKFSFHFYCYKYFLIFLVIVS